MTTTAKPPTPWASVAATVRRELKARREELGIPATATIRVASSSFAGGASVDVTISGADDWAWRTATADDFVVHQGYYRAGDTILNWEAVGEVGDRIAGIIEAARDAAQAGYIWGGVTYDGTIIGSLAQWAWTPGQD